VPTIPRASRSAPVKASWPVPDETDPAAGPLPPPPLPAPALAPLPPALPPFPAPLPPLPPAPAVPPPGGVGVVEAEAGATAGRSGPAVPTLSREVLPVTSANSVSASRTPYGPLVWPPLLSLALHTAVSSGLSDVKSVFAVPFAQPAAGIGRPVPARFRTVEFWFTELLFELQAGLSELPWRASALSGPTFALATPESPCAVWQLPSLEMLPWDVSASALTPVGPPTCAPRSSCEFVEELLVLDECMLSRVRQSWLPL